MWSRPESNWNPGLRRPLYYPLYYRTDPFAERGVKSRKNRRKQPDPKGWQNYELFQQSPQVSAEYFDRNSQEDDPKKLSDGDHSGWPEEPFDEIKGFEHDENEDQV